MSGPPERQRGVVTRLLIAGAGVISLHQLAYLLAHPGDVSRAAASQGHGYLAPVATAVLPAALAVVVWVLVCRLSVSGGRTRALAVPRTGEYALVFAAQEVLERLVAGRSALSTLAEPAVWLGLALVPLLGLATRVLTRSVEGLEPVPASVVVASRPLLRALVPDAPSLPLHPLTPAVLRVRGPPSPTR